MKKQLVIVGSIILAVLLVDQLVKIYIKTQFFPGETVSVFGDWFVLEYIENKPYESLFTISNEEFYSIFMQIELAIIILALDYRISHGDLNSGNILIAKTNNKIIKYNISGKCHNIKSFGIIPKLIDYGRCSNYIGRGKICAEPIIDDVFIAFSVLRMYLNQNNQKKLTEWYSNYIYPKDINQFIIDTQIAIMQKTVQIDDASSIHV